MSTQTKRSWWNLDLECKPDFEMSMKRIYAWFEGEIIDRAPVRFSSHNAQYNEISPELQSQWKSLKDRWFDEEYQIHQFENSIRGKTFLGETFPVFFPNLGPNVYASFYGCPIEFGEVTSWAEPFLKGYSDIHKLKLDIHNEYFKKIESMTTYALSRCEGKFMVGYTDLHPGADCAAAWRGTEDLCMDFYDDPDQLKKLLEISETDFIKIFNYYDALLKAQSQLSVTWMGIPSFGKMHIPSCDFSAMISNQQFEEYCLPGIMQEVTAMTHNVFHLDGKDVAKNLDTLLGIKEIQAIQWVQGVGTDQPILQWVPLIKKIQAAGKSVVVDLTVGELEEFIGLMDPKGLLLCISSDCEEEQKRILERVKKW